MRLGSGDGSMSHSEFDLDWEAASEEIVTFIQRVVAEARAGGIVVGLSGGVDSSLVAALSVRALGKEKVLGVMMPTDFTPKEDIQDARDLAKMLGIQTKNIMIRPIMDCFAEALRLDEADPHVKIPLANICSRIRMVILYYFANLYNYLVAGTGDRSEDLIGYFTKYGDGGADFLPISHLYKTQVRRLAEYLGIPTRVAYKPSSPQLYPGQKVTDELPLDYDRLDHIERMLFDEKLSPQEIAEKVQVSIDIVEDVSRRYCASKHKRTYPPMVRQ